MHTSLPLQQIHICSHWLPSTLSAFARRFRVHLFKEGWKGEVRNEASEFDPRDHYSTCSTNLTMKEVFLFVSPQTNSKNFELETLLRKGLDKIKVLLIGALHRLGWNNLFCCCMYDNVLNQNSDPHLTTCWFQDTNPGLQCQIQCFISRTTHSVLLPTVFLQYRNFLHWEKKLNYSQWIVVVTLVFLVCQTFSKSMAAYRR